MATEIPKDAPRESTTVPTMTSAATMLRVMIIMTLKMRQIAATPAISKS